MDGIINVYKPCGISSFDVVRKIKKLSKIKRVGHTGTLDPEASGVLPICIGKATKLVDYIMSGEKCYRAILKLGVVTDTYDREGIVLSTKDIVCNEEEVIKVINSFKGEIEQIPPMYSAIKVNGKKLYELARKGIEIERAPRKITIHDIKIVNMNLPYITMDINCSKGTYIRSLCYDIGEKLNCGGTMWALERLSSGEFSVDNSVKLEELTEDNLESFLLPMDEALNKYKALFLDLNYEKLVLNGVPIKNSFVVNSLDKNCIYRVYLKDNRFIGLGKLEDNSLKIIKRLT